MNVVWNLSAQIRRRCMTQVVTRRVSQLKDFVLWRRGLTAVVLMIPLLLPSEVHWAVVSLAPSRELAPGVLQTPVACSIAPNSGILGSTQAVTISVGPHMLISQYMAALTPSQMRAATSMNFSPGGAEVALLQATYLLQQVIYSGVITIAPEALPGVRNLGIRIQPMGLPSSEFICPLAFTVETPEERLQRAHQAFRAEVAGALQVMGRQMGVAVQAEDFVASFDDDRPLVVSAPITGTENLPIEELARGADLLFVFLRLPHGSDLPSGFYVIRVSRELGGWRARFRNAQGRVVLETPMEVEIRETEQEAQKPKYKLTAKGKLIPPTLIVDWHKREKMVQVDAQIEIPLGTGGPDGTPLPQLGQAILRAADTFMSAAREGIAAGAKLTKADAARTIGGGSSADVFVVWTYTNGLERASIEELARGRTSFLTFGGGKFWLYRIWRDANGQWLTTSQSPNGESYTSPAEVSPSGVSTRVPILLTSIEPDDISPTLVTPTQITIKQPDCGCKGCCVPAPPHK